MLFTGFFSPMLSLILHSEGFTCMTNECQRPNAVGWPHACQLSSLWWYTCCQGQHASVRTEPSSNLNIANLLGIEVALNSKTFKTLSGSRLLPLNSPIPQACLTSAVNFLPNSEFSSMNFDYSIYLLTT